MRDSYQVVVIGGGIVGCSVAYHLTLRGLTDVALVERAELTAGSSLARRRRVPRDQRRPPTSPRCRSTRSACTTQVERRAGASIGMHMSGGIELAGTPERCAG